MNAGEGLDLMANFASKGVEMGMQSAFATAQAKRNAQIQTQQMKEQNELLRKNYQDSEGLAKSGKIAAGMSPLGEFQSTNISPTLGGAGESVSYPQDSSYNAVRQLNIQESLAKSEEDKNRADEILALAEAKKVGFESDFLGGTLDSRIKLTNKENANKYYIEGYFEEHPELMQEVAKAQTLLNNKVRSEIDVNKENISVLKSIVEKNASDISLNEAKKALTIIQTTLTKEQIQVLKDENFRNNMNNYGYLLGQIADVTKSDLPDTAKSEKISLLKDVLGYVSGATLKEKEFGYQKFLQARDLAVKQDIANKDRAVNKQHADAVSKIADTQQLKVESDIVFHTIELFVDIIGKIFSAIPSLISSFF